MAAIKINKGDAYHEDRLSESPRERWAAIIDQRRYYLETNIDYDCRCLVQYVTEAEIFYAELGYSSAEEMVLGAYCIKPEQAWAAVAYLNGRITAGPIPLRQAIEAQKHATTALALEGTFAEEGNPHGNPDNIRVNASEGGNSAAYLAARLKKAKREDLLREIGPSKRLKSVRAAAIEAGIIKSVPTIRLVDDITKVAIALRKHLTAEKVAELKALL